MPHFVIDCSQKILKIHTPENIMNLIHETAHNTGLFLKGGIKVRIRPFIYSNVGGENSDFIHVFGHIMEGRSIEQKADLSKKIITELKSIFPNVPVVSINIQEFEKSTYCNRNLI
jgi:5-carboxymethyl-2-hydroxymuconate isomerase